MLVRSANTSFIKGLCVGLSVSLLFVIQQQGYSLYMAVGVGYRDVVSRSRQLQELSLDNLRHPLEVSFNDKDEKLRKTQQTKKWVAQIFDEKQHRFDDAHRHKDEDEIAKRLQKEVRIACWILTSPKNLYKKAIHVKETWAKRCNVYLFMSSEQDPMLPAIGLNVSEGREHLTAKTMQAFKYMYDNHILDADWFLKADDDTYVIMENLRYFLSEENPNEPVIFGQRFKPFVEQGYASGGSGYVLSKESLLRFGTKGFNRTHICAIDKGPEDLQMGKCLQNLGVKLKSSLDALRRTRFHCLSPEHFVTGMLPKWYLRYDLEGVGGGIANMSDYAISFHYVSPRLMYTLEYFTYHLQPYGIINKPQELNQPSNGIT